MYVPRPSQLIRGLNRTLLVNLDYTIMTLVPRGYQVVQVRVRSCPNLHSSFINYHLLSICMSSTTRVYLIYR
jgi:hypothetical protein